MKKLVRITSVPLSMEKLLGSQLSYMNGFYEVIAVSSDKEQLKSVAENLGIKHFAVEMTRKISPFQDLVAIYRMYCFFRKVKPDIVHSHTPKAGLVGMIAAYLARVPVRLHTVAGLPLMESRGKKRMLLSGVESIIYTAATKVYPNSRELEKIILKEKFCGASKLKVLGNGSSNGIDTNYFNPRQILEQQKEVLKAELGIKKEDFVFIFLGRLVKDKGINELVSAFRTLVELRAEEIKNKSNTDSEGAKIAPLHAPKQNGTKVENEVRLNTSRYNGNSISGLDIRHRLGKVFYRTASDLSVPVFMGNEESFNLVNPYTSTLSNEPMLLNRAYPNIRLLLVGPLEQELNPLLGLTLKEMKNNPLIIETDYVQDVRPYLALSDCLILPSYREGFPNAVLQAGAMSLPSIVTDINGCNEIISDGVNGLIIPVKNEKDLEVAMRKMIDEPENYQKMKNLSRPKVVERYSQQKIWEALLKEYQEALSK